MFEKLPREFYLRDDTLQIARQLLGKILVVPSETGERVSGMIVEAEAYLGAIDKAAHSYGNRRTQRTETMYAVGGTAYIFFIFCLRTLQPQLVSDNVSDGARRFRPACPATVLDHFLTRLGPRDPAGQRPDDVLRHGRPNSRAFLLHERDVAIFLAR